MLQCKLRLNKEERDIVTKAAIKHFNTLINGYHPMLTVKKDSDCSYLTLQMDGFYELCYYILFDEYDDGSPFYLVYYGRLNWGGLPNWRSPDKKCDSLQSVGIVIAEHYADYIWNENESLHFKDINMDNKLEARITRLEKMLSRKNESINNDVYLWQWGLEPTWTDLSDMLATRTDDQLLKWKEVAENPRIDNYRSITTLRELVVDLYNKSIKDIVNELSIAVNDELDSRNGDIGKKLESRVARLEKLLNIKNESNDSNLEYISDDIERGLKRELGVNLWDISAKPVYNKRYEDGYVEVVVESGDYDTNEVRCVFKVYSRGYGYRVEIVGRNGHIGSLDSLDEVVSMISDFMAIMAER